MPILQCERCGFIWESNTARKNITRCTSCRARKMKTVNTDKGKCFPWQGQFARDETTPVDEDGFPILPGVRRCGNNDCCNVDHIDQGKGLSWP